MEDERADEDAADDGRSCTSGVTEGPEVDGADEDGDVGDLDDVDDAEDADGAAPGRISPQNVRLDRFPPLNEAPVRQHFYYPITFCLTIIA